MLVEREHELAAIERLLDEVRDGYGGVLVIHAPAGHGKSRLMSVAGDRAREAGLGVLGAQATELERDFPFSVVLQLLEPMWLSIDPARRVGLAAGAAAVGAKLLDGQMSATSTSATDAAFGVIHGLFSLVRALAGADQRPHAQGLVMLIDDAHWADAPSWRFLAYLVERIAELPVAVVVAVRSGEVACEPRALSALRADAGRQVLTPRALSQAGVAALIRNRLPDASDPFVWACADTTAGNPFLLTSLLDVVVEDRLTPDRATAEKLAELTPGAVLDSVVGRLAGLHDDCRAVACALAVLGDGSPVAHVAELAELPWPRTAAAADTLAAHHLLRPGAPLSFVHPLIQSAVRASMPALERARAHRRAALMLLGHGASAEVVAAQLLHAPPEADPRAIEALASAARHAMVSGAPESAVRLLERARAEDPLSEHDPELLAEQAEAEAAAGLPAAIEHLQQAIARSPSKARRSALRLVLVNAYLAQHRYVEASDVVTEAIAQTPVGGPAHEGDLALLATARFVPELGERARTRGAALMAMATAPLSAVHRRALAEEALNRGVRGDPHARVQAVALRAWDDGALLDAAPPHHWRLLTSTLHFIDELEHDIEICDTVIARGHDPGRDELRTIGRCCRAWALFEQGRITEALADARAALNWLPENWMRVRTMRPAYSVLALALIEQGDFDQAETALSILDLPDTAESVDHPALLEARARLRLAQGRLQEAAHDAARAGRACGRLNIVSPGVVPWRSTQARALVGLGEHHEAVALATEELDLAWEIGIPRIVVRATRCLGLASRGKTRDQRLRHAVALGDDLPPRREHIESLLAWGAALRRSNQRKAAREPLQRAVELAQSGGATRLAELARAELIATGGPGRRLLEGGGIALTPRERAVAELAGTGQTTRAMAETLFVTPKTIEYHLRQIYRKLDINSRAELASALERERERERA